jgi:hypothetical protein
MANRVFDRRTSDRERSLRDRIGRIVRKIRQPRLVVLVGLNGCGINVLFRRHPRAPPHVRSGTRRLSWPDQLRRIGRIGRHVPQLSDEAGRCQRSPPQAGRGVGSAQSGTRPVPGAAMPITLF